MSNFRSQKLRDLAKLAPKCMSCGVENWGQVVGAHWRSLADGAGTGLKPNDLLAYVCDECHDHIDQRADNLTRNEREGMWLIAFKRSILWLLESGHLEVKG